MRKLATLLMMVFALSAKAQQTPSYQHTIDLGVGLRIPGHTDPGMIDNRPVDETLHKMPIPCDLPVYDESPLGSGRYSQFSLLS